MTLSRQLAVAALGLLLGVLGSAAQVTVTLSPSSATVSLTQPQDFTAVVTGTADRTVKWKVCDANGKNCVLNGSTSIGTLVDIGADSSGNRIGRYTAPAVLPSPPACATVAGGCQLTIKAIKKIGLTKFKATAPITLTQGVSITTTALPDGVVGVGYSQALGAVNGTAPLNWTLAAGSGPLPTGLSVSSGGLISGTPVAAGTFSFTIQVTDSGSPPTSDTQALSLRVVDPLAISTSSLLDGDVGVAYSQTLAATGGTSPFTWGLAAGALPPGLSLASSGVLSGLPASPGTFNFTPQVVDASSPPQVATRGLSLVIRPAPLAITTSILPAATVNVPYNVFVLASGGTPPHTWSETTAFFDDSTGAGSGACAALQLDFVAGTFSGTPAAVGTCGPFTLRVADSAGQSVTASFSITISASLGRNDSIATATALSNGTFSASISPFADPVDATPANPDTDYYWFTATGGVTVTVEVIARRLPTPSPIDSVIEIVGADGVRFTTCRNVGTDDGVNFGSTDPTPNDFDDLCLNDDMELGVLLDSRLDFLVPGSGPVTFLVRVLDWRGDARPDLTYNLVIAGAN